MIDRMAVVCSVGVVFMCQAVPAVAAEAINPATTAGTRDTAPTRGEEFWSAGTGQAVLMINHEPLEKMGVFVAEGEERASTRRTYSAPVVKVISQPGLWFAVVNRGVSSLYGRYIEFEPPLTITGPKGSRTVSQLAILHDGIMYPLPPGMDSEVQPIKEGSLPALVLNDIKTGFVTDTPQLKIFGRSLTISHALAEKMGDPELAGVSLGNAMVTLDARWVGGAEPVSAPSPQSAVDEPPACVGPNGPDITFCQLYNLRQYGRLGDIVGLAVATTSWNIGDLPAAWFESPSPDHPVIIMNLYRRKNDRFEQIGQSWAKHGFCALSNTQCGGKCLPSPCDTLSCGCTDTYSSALNSARGSMGPKHEVNPWTGEWSFNGSHFEQFGIHEHNPIEHRIQVHDDDLAPASNPGATYYVEAFYCHQDDINAMNTVAWKPVTPFVDPLNSDRWLFSMTDATDFPNIGWAIDAWAGAEQTLLAQQVPVVEFVSPDGRCVLATKVTALPGGLRWHYEYALLNVDMDRKVGSFSVPLRPGVSMTNIGFHAVESHDVPFSNNPWTHEVTTEAITWSTEYNPLRWGALYNFRFDADLPPGNGTVTLGLYDPAPPEQTDPPDTVQGTAKVPTLFGPELVHGAPGMSVHGHTFTGYIDPRMESSNKLIVNLGMREVTLVFSEPVERRGGGELTRSSFLVRQTGGLTPPSVEGVATADGQTVTVALSRIITPMEWTTIQCKVQSINGGVPIPNRGDLGPGVPEPDRIDIGYLPGDITQDGIVTPADLIRYRQYLSGSASPTSGALTDYVDTNRDILVTPDDLIKFRQLLSGAGNALRTWAAVTMNNQQP